MLLLNNGAQLENNYKVLSADDINESLPAGNYLFPVTHIDSALRFQAKRSNNTGLWIDSSDELEFSLDHLAKFDVIAINFSKFIDGRGYSIAYLLHKRIGYKGDIRAIGDVLVDQLNYMRRCGFSSFALREDQDLEAAVREMNGFSSFYQVSADENTPAYRLRHHL